MNARPRPALQAAAAAALGALQTPAFVHTAWLWWLPLLTMALLVAGLDTATPRRAALLGWSYGTGWLAAGVWWLFVSMHRYGGLPAPLAALAVAALAAALSLYLAAACAAYAHWRRGRARDALLFASLWLLAELARGVVFTGFPWVAAGYSQVDSPLALAAPWTGVYGVCALLAWLAAAVASLRGGLARAGRAVAVPVLLLLAAGLASRDFTRGVGSLDVALLQTNVEQDEKFAVEHMAQSLSWVARELMVARADLVVAPETAVPLLPDQLTEFAPGYWAQLQAHFGVPGRAALVGVPLGDFEHGYTNSVAGLSAAGAGGGDYRYDKWHLVPFGEFVPRGFRWFTEAMDIPLGDFNRGSLTPPSFAVGSQRLAPNVCYEDLFGEELARRFVLPERAPTVLVNVSNMAWFGDSAAITQHLNISRMRALELQRPVVRATNTGATAAIDHRGEVTALLPPNTRGVLQARVEGREGSTPFAAWASRWGLGPLLVLALLGAGVGGTRGRRWAAVPRASRPHP